MTEFLTKEEIKQWRSSVEKITLEEFAARLGKTIQEEKETHDIVDIIYKEDSKAANGKDGLKNKEIKFIPKPEKIETLIKSANMDLNQPKLVEVQKPVIKKIEVMKPIKVEKTEEIKEIQPVKIEEPKLVEKHKPAEKVEKTAKIEKTEIKVEEPKEEKNVVIEKPVESNSTSGDITITFKKALTEREQAVFDHLKQNRGQTVFAKDLADLLNLKRDYVYKYIKNLRSKIVEDILQNSGQGGFTLK
ncbi:MAG: hypothetical protein WC197_09005 [Candidatus Gastranaerophilaceae bacterium]|jgi:hypothetical protein